MPYSLLKVILRKSLVLLLLLFTFSVFAQSNINTKQIDEHLRKHVKFLASDKLMGRLVGSKGEQKAANYIAAAFKKNGLSPKGTSGYFQSFTVKKNIKNPHGGDHDAQATTITGNNVIGYIDNKAKYTVVIGAHYDHLGYNEYGSSTYRSTDSNEKPMIHNGADDNASGTAALIELSRLLAQSTHQQHNYLFIAFSGEEEGLLGSNYFTKSPTIDTATLAYMINMDMVGRLDTIKQSFAISGTGTSPEWDPHLNKVLTPLKVKYDKGGTGASDHTSFYYINIPALHFFTGSHYDYHKPSDDEEKINYHGMVQIIDYIYQLTGLLNHVGKLPFTPTAQDSTEKITFKVTLGIMPDYLYDGKGVRIDGTTPGKPAAKANLMRGDIIIKLGETNVTDMQAYMQCLKMFKKGDVTTIIILRGTEEKQLEVTF